MGFSGAGCVTVDQLLTRCNHGT